MSRRKKQNNHPMAYVVFILGWLLFAFMVLGTSFILIGWLLCELLYRQHPWKPEKASVLLDQEEVDELKRTQHHLTQINRRLRDIETEGQHLRRRKDGMYHAGSALGAKLNAEISELMQDRTDSRAILHELATLPSERLHVWSIPLARLLAFRWAAAVYASSVLYGILLMPVPALYMHGLILRNMSDILPFIPLPLYGAMAFASITAALCGAGAYIFYSRYIYTFYDRQIFKASD